MAVLQIFGCGLYRIAHPDVMRPPNTGHIDDYACGEHDRTAKDLVGKRPFPRGDVDGEDFDPLLARSILTLFAGKVEVGDGFDFDILSLATILYREPATNIAAVTGGKATCLSKIRKVATECAWIRAERRFW